MIKTQNDIDTYFTTDNFDTDKKVELANDKVLLKQFLSAVVTHITNKSPRSIYFHPTNRYSWNSTAHTGYSIGLYKFKHDTKKQEDFTFEINYNGGELKVKQDNTGCVYITGNKKRKSLKVTEHTILIRPEWIKPLILVQHEKAQKIETDGKIMKFQNELLAPYMMQKLIDRGIPESLISIQGSSSVMVSNLGSKHWWASCRVYPINDEPTDNIEDRKWTLNMHKTYLSDLTFESVINVLGAFQDSGLFKL